MITVRKMLRCLIYLILISKFCI